VTVSACQRSTNNKKLLIPHLRDQELSARTTVCHTQEVAGELHRRGKRIIPSTPSTCQPFARSYALSLAERGQN